MRVNKKRAVIIPTRRSYRRPVLKALGRVQELTLKIGSISDGMGSHE